MKVGGRDFDLMKEEVEARMEGQSPESIQKYAVAVNGEMFPPKQVLGSVTGWPRSSFTTTEAQRVLTRLGFDCVEARGAAMYGAGQVVMDVVRDSAQQVMSGHDDDQHRRGFAAAAGIAIGRIQGKLDASREQMKNGGLSHAEQAVYAHVDELKSEIEAECDRYWRGTGVDWRPVKPVAKVVSQRVGDSGS